MTYFTGTAGGDYDAAPYDAVPLELSSMETVLGFARTHGRNPSVADVLDLGCGFGRQLAQVAPRTAGRLVGVDASRASCDGARDVLKPWSNRAEIVHSDFADLDGAVLGSFDLIYCVGTLYAGPEPMRADLLRLISGCLRPGGLALLTYNAGTKGLIKAAVSRYLQALQPGGQMSVGLAAARQHMAVISQFQTPAPIAAVQQMVDQIAKSDDIVLAHEMLGHGVTPLNTAVIASELAPSGIRFLGYVGYDVGGPTSDDATKLFIAETLDLLEGGYRYALFARDAG